MINRRICLVSIAAMSLGVGSSVLLHADDKMPDADKMQQQVQAEEKESQELHANFTDAGFVKLASMANTDEIKASEYAMKTSKNGDVRKFAQQMIDDHTKAGMDLKELAEKKGWTVSEQCDAKHKIAMEEMKKLSGAEFDKSYAVAGSKDHQEAVALFKLASEKVSDADLKAFVNKTLPTLEHHYKMAQDLEGKMMASKDDK